MDAVVRRCTVCAMRGRNVPATHVAGGMLKGTEIQWFECSSHLANDNHLEVTRTYHATILEWMATIARLCENVLAKSERPSGG